MTALLPIPFGTPLPVGPDHVGDILAQQTRLLRTQVASAAHYKKMYDRASALARIGVWECDLSDNHLVWTDGVYDLFEMPRGMPIDRDVVAALYDEPSRVEMERLRAYAIATCGSFSMDARIHTLKGNVRWMRLTADVEQENGRAVRLFGSKQDITEERLMWDQLRQMAERDSLTGLANRRLFQAQFVSVEPNAAAPGALLLIDLDGFKLVNDRFGHSAGDECLRVVADRLSAMSAHATLVARIGGDEFAIVMPAPCTAEWAIAQADALLVALRQPVPWRGQMLEIGASIGIALPEALELFSPTALFAEADSALYAAKSPGRNGVQLFATRSSAA